MLAVIKMGKSSVISRGFSAEGSVNRKLQCKFNWASSTLMALVGIGLGIGSYFVYVQRRDGKLKDDDGKVTYDWTPFVVMVIMAVIFFGGSFFNYFMTKEKCSIYSKMSAKSLAAGDATRSASNLAYGLIGAAGTAAQS